MTHVFVAAHPDDVALSCGGLIASLREVGHNVTVVCVYSGDAGTFPADIDPSEHHRTSFGYGTKTLWPAGEAFNRTNILPDYEVVTATAGAPWAADPERIALTQDRANTQARQFWQRAAWTRSANITNQETDARPIAESIGGQGTFEEIDFERADAMTLRRAEEERFIYLMEASVVFLDLPPAPERGYSGDDQLLGTVRDDDLAPYRLVRQEIERLEPQMVYFPLAIGHHVDHQLLREIGLGLLAEERRWVMPGPDYVGHLSFYEDFPYAWWHDFSGPADLPPELADLPAGVVLEPRYCDIGEMLDRKAAGLRLYPSQIRRLFESDQAMLDDLTSYHTRVALGGGTEGPAERYWTTRRI